MRIYKYLFFLGLLTLAACKGQEKVPDNVIGEDRMPALIADMHIVDGDLYNVSQLPDSLYKYGMGSFLLVLKKHHTDTAAFKRSFTWYTKRPERLEEIYNKAIIILQKKNDSIAKLPPTAKPATPPIAAPAAKPATVPVSGPTSNAPLKNAVSSQ